MTHTLPLTQAQQEATNGNHATAIEHYLTAEKICKANNDHPTLCTIYTQLSHSYATLKEHKKSLAYAMEAFAISKELHGLDNLTTLTIIKQIADAYIHVALKHNNQQYSQKALTSLQEVKQKVSHLDPSDPFVISLNVSIAYVYHKLNMHDNTTATLAIIKDMQITDPLDIEKLNEIDLYK